MKISAVAVTERGMQLGKRLQEKSGGEILLHFCGDEEELFVWTKENYSSAEALIFIGAAEFAVQAISHFVSMKNRNPAVVVLDELGKFTIPILSGHIDAANKLAVVLAGITEGIPVITAGSAEEEVFSVDTWAKAIGLRIANPNSIKNVSSKLRSGGVIYYDSVFPISGETPKGIEPSKSSEMTDFLITYLASVPDKTLHLVPPVLTLGLDCLKDTSYEDIKSAYAEFLKECGCHPLAVREVCSIDQKQGVNGLNEFCKELDLPLRVFSENMLLNAIGLFTPSKFDGQLAAVENVCERSAVLGSGGTLFVRKMDFGDISMAMAIKEPDISEQP